MFIFVTLLRRVTAENLRWSESNYERSVPNEHREVVRVEYAKRIIKAT